MPETEKLVIKYLREIKGQLGEIKDAYPINKAIEKTRLLLKGIHFTKVRVATAIYLLQTLLLHDPKIVTVIETLNHPSLNLSQSSIIFALTDLVHGPGRGRKGILVKSDDGDRISLNYSLLKKINE